MALALTAQNVSIPAGMSLSTSTVVSGANKQVVALVLPPAWDPAPITLRWSNNNISWHDVFDHQGHESSLVWAADALVPFYRLGPFPFPYIQVRSGSREAAVPQSTTRQFTILSQ